MKRTRYLTEAQAWRVIARQFAEPRTVMGANGLCVAVCDLWYDGRITNRVEIRMHNRIWAAMPEGNRYGWAYNEFGPEARAARCLAALWFALDAADDAKRGRAP